MEIPPFLPQLIKIKKKEKRAIFGIELKSFMIRFLDFLKKRKKDVQKCGIPDILMMLIVGVNHYGWVYFF